MQTIINRTFDEIALGDSASAERTLLAGDVRAWAAACGEADSEPAPLRARWLPVSSPPC
jgi:hypothetical protein